MKITVKDFIEELKKYNPEAIVTVGDNLYNGVEISWSGPDNCDKKDCDCVCLDQENSKKNNENIISNIDIKEIEDWTKNIAIPKLYKSGIIKSDRMILTDIDLKIGILTFRSLDNIRLLYFIPLEWYYVPEDLDKYIKIYGM